MSVAEIVQFYHDTIDLLEKKLTPQEFGMKYGI